MPATIIKGGNLLAPDGLKSGWGVKMSGGRLIQVAENARLAADPGDTVIDVRDQIIMPGFVNGHNHMYGFLSHGITTEALVTEFSSFLDDFWWPYVENRVDHELVRRTTRWACVEMIDSGVTSFVDILEAPNALPGALEIEAEIVREAGLRGLLSFEACERVSAENGELGLRENADFVRANNRAGEPVQGLISVHTLFTCGKDYLRRAKALSDELGCSLHMHLSESVFEPDWCEKHYGKKPVEIYEEIGYLGKNVLASQVVQTGGGELDTLAKHGVRAVTMPLSNCEVGGGVAPVMEMLRRGMTVGLGTDGYINNFFEVMRGAFLIHKAYLQDPQAMPAKTVVEMATSMGARAAGFPDAGRLEEGCAADVITVSLDTPTPINANNVYDQLVLFRNPEHVRNVWVDGKQLKKDGSLLTVDRDRAKEQLREAAERFWKKP